MLTNISKVPITVINFNVILKGQKQNFYDNLNSK